MSMSRLAVLAVSVSLIMTGCSSLSSLKRDKKPDAGPKMSERAYYEDAQRSLNASQFDEATRSLQALDTYYPVGPYTEQSQLDLMYSNLRKSDFAGAASVADRFIRLYPNHAQLDYAYYLRGVANMETGNDGLLRYTNLNQAHRDTSFLRLAYNNFTDFLKRFPNSRFAPDATQRLRFMVNQFAESEINVARFQIKRHAWMAAVQRARWVIEYYPQTPQVPEALATAAYSYQKMGMADLAQPYVELLKINYPALVDGNQVRLSAAQTQASLLNRLTLGIAGRRVGENAATPAPSGDTITQPISRAATGMAQPPVISQAQALQQAQRPERAAPDIGLALPADSGINAPSDPQPVQTAP
jgi:outer membrane protein assembly factor BamD